MFKHLCLVVLLVVSIQGYKDTMTVLAEIDREPFGNAMISAIQLNLAAKAPGDEIVVLVDQIIDDLETKQTAADKANKTNQADCDKTLNSLKTQIAETKTNNKKLKDAIKENTETVKQAEIDLNEAKSDYNEVMEAIATGAKERKKSHKKWANEDYAQSIQITTLDEGTKLINHMIHGVAFSQVQSRYEKVLDTLKNSKGHHAGLFKPLVTSLTQLATKLNYENVMNILKLLADIRKSIVATQASARKDETTAQNAWEKRLKDLEKQKKALSDKKNRLTNLLASTSKIIANDKKSLEQGKVTLEELGKSLKEKIAQCATWSKEYAKLSKEISRELEILNKLRKYVKAKAASIAEYAKKREANKPKF